MKTTQVTEVAELVKRATTIAEQHCGCVLVGFRCKRIERTGELAVTITLDDAGDEVELRFTNLKPTEQEIYDVLGAAMYGTPNDA